MYRELYEEMVAQINEEAAMEIAPKKKKGLIERPEKTKEEAKDPLSLMRQWMQIIKSSGEEARKKGEALMQTPPKSEPQAEAVPEKKTPLPEEEPKEIAKKKVASMFDSFDEWGGEGGYRLPVYKGNNGEWVSLARQTAGKYGIPEDLFLTLVNQESGWQEGVRSPTGAIGLAQLMPATARELGVNPYNPEQNLDGGARYLKQQYDKFGRWDYALAAYNAGPGAVEKHKGIPPYAETQNYVRSILQ